MYTHHLFATRKICKDFQKLGFGERCLAYYDTNGSFIVSCYKPSLWNTPALLWQQCIDWIRKKYSINIILFGDGFSWTFDLRRKDPEDILQYPTVFFPKPESERILSTTYEEAREVSILKVLEIIKSEK